MPSVYVICCARLYYIHIEIFNGEGGDKNFVMTNM